MGWTWTLGVQFQFYLALPIIWRYMGAAKGLRTIAWLGVVVSFVLRALSHLQLRDLEGKTMEYRFFSFFWYATAPTPCSPTCPFALLGADHTLLLMMHCRYTTTLTRWSAVWWGVLMAYYSTYGKVTLRRLWWCAWGYVACWLTAVLYTRMCLQLQESLRRNKVLVWAGWALVAASAYCARVWDFEFTLDQHVSAAALAIECVCALFVSVSTVRLTILNTPNHRLQL